MSELSSGGEPGTDVLAGLSKVIFPTTLTEPLSWPNTQLVGQDPVKAVRQMKAEGTRSIRRRRGTPLDCGGGDEQSRVVCVEVAGRV